MKPIAKRKWEDLESVILAYYEEQEQSNKRKKITLRTLYPKWFAYKWQDTNNSGYMNHIDGEWKRYYENDPIVDRPVVEFTTLELKNCPAITLQSSNQGFSLYTGHPQGSTAGSLYRRGRTEAERIGIRRICGASKPHRCTCGTD